MSAAQAARLPAIVRDAPAGATIRLADGTYRVGSPLVVSSPRVILRSASGNPAGVVLDGAYGLSALVHVFGNDVTIAELTLKRARDHLACTSIPVTRVPMSAGSSCTGCAWWTPRSSS